ncbi:MAG: NADH-quinone oxidoreductase subunit C [Nitrospirales bacterium]|nr:NADH-quinone oxidoreductase subunit C [Nitrospirales bacterium]
MQFEEIITKLKEKFGEEHIKPVTELAGDPYAFVPADKIVEMVTFLRDTPEFQFDCLSNLTGVDAPPDDLDAVYHFFSYDPAKFHSLTLKIRVPKSNPKIPTIEKVYPTANWQEREAFDLVGLQFEGHSDLRRIMLPDDWKGHPLRKDYQEEEDYHGIDTTRPSLLGT